MFACGSFNDLDCRGAVDLNQGVRTRVEYRTGGLVLKTVENAILQIARSGDDGE